MTTPDTAAVRSWAREQGLGVAARGRLPAEVVDAYTAAHPESPGGAPAEGAAPSGKPRTTTGRRSPAPRRKAVIPAREPAPVRPQPAPVAVVPAPAAVEDDRRVAELVQQVAALSQRVAALEAAEAARPPRRFRFGR